MWWTDERVIARFERKYRRGAEDECWEWKGSASRGGYGRFWINKDRGLTGPHRFALERKIGKPLGDLDALHHCDNPPCVNPAHLYAGTDADNVQDKMARGRMRTSDQRGERNGAARLTAEQAAEIYQIRNTFGGPTGREVAKRFGVSEATVSEIKNRRHWK